MRTWQIVVVTAVLGAVTGVGHALTRYRDPGPELQSFLDNPLPSQNIVPREDSAVLVVENGVDHDFGTMERGETLEHTFIFRNDGTRPLTIDVVGTTCMCMLPELESGAIPPGQSREVVLRWVAKKYEKEFHQTATIATSDPRRRVVTLTVHGHVLPPARCVPATVAVGNISAQTSREMQSIIYGYQSDTLEVTGTKWLKLPLQGLFDVQFRPATTEELEREPNARAAIVCQLQIKPGLPLGSFHQRLTVDLKTNKTTSVEIPIVGAVVGDITVAGRGYNASRRVLRLGHVVQDQGKKTMLFLTAKGPHRESVQPTIKLVEPADALSASFGQSKSSAKAVMYPLTVEVPAGAPFTNRLGNDQEHPAGRIVIETKHPAIPEIELRVRFAVAN